MSAVSPNQCSRALTLAPRAISAFTASTLPGARGGHEHRLAFGFGGRVGIGAGLEQRVDDRRAAVGRGERDRRHAVAVRRP